MADRCQMELCPHWAGDGNVCPCAVLELPEPGRGAGHMPSCDPGGTCVECDGCECGAVPSTCTGQGCYSRDAYDQWCDENGYSSGVYG